TWADVDNDGWLDLYVCGFDCPNRLYMNRAEGKSRRLVESARSLGVDLHSASVVGTFSDYDRDGDLDLFVVTNRLPAPESLKTRKFTLQRGPKGEPVLPEAFRQYADVIVRKDGKGLQQIDAGQYDYLYRNEGPGKPFKDVTAESGLSGNHYGLSATWWDWNQDGWPDLYVANDFFGPDQLWTNRGPGKNGIVTFTDMTPTSLPHTPWFSMGSDFADINNDGLFDLFATDMAGSTHYNEKMQMGNMSGPDSDAWFLNHPDPPQYMRNALYLNSGTYRFMEAADLLGISKTDWTWSVNFGDLDNDGREDLFVTNGMSRDWLNSDLRARAPSKDGWDRYYDFWYAQKPLYQTNRVFRNQGDLKMTEVGAEWGLDQNSVSFGAALSDLDGDGDLDLAVNNFNGPPSLFKNTLSSRNRLTIKLVGQQSNRFGLGSTLTLRSKSGDTQSRFLTSARGFMSSPEPLVHFGLGEETIVAELTVQWPGGHKQSLTNLKANHRYTITEPSGRPAAQTRPPRETLFARSRRFPGIRHEEKPHDDFATQPLLPNKLSQLGPGIAFADVNGDQIQDFYLGQGAGTAGRLFIGRKSPDAKGRYYNLPANPAFAAHAGREDLDAVFLDADGDGDEDLFVVSGGVEGAPGTEVYRDRLYLNNGEGTFSHAGEAITGNVSSGGPAALADFDRDGDLDLFVGGRVVPGSYPTGPESQLLRNDSSGETVRFTNVAAKQNLDSIGMVTAALWADLDGDSWPDLVTTTEWGTVQVFFNHQGTLQTPTGTSAMSQRTGWWSSLSAGDLDGDGDLDLIAGNTGFNTKYKASTDKPELLFYGDFDGTGKPKILEAKFEGEVCLPRRGYSCSSHAMPTLKNKLKTFHSFASQSLEGIYSESRLKQARRFEANTLASGLFFNLGKGRFSKLMPLPRIAQAFPVHQSAAADFTGDGKPDLFLVGNSH
ncbi:MAG: VCBS repeat-containing protein, partial [Verrucomicrobiota bacterium]